MFVFVSTLSFPPYAVTSASEPDFFLVSTPLFTRTDIRLGQTGKSLSIKASESPETHPYITAAVFNGNNLDRAWLTHKELSLGSTLELTLGDSPIPGVPAICQV